MRSDANHDPGKARASTRERDLRWVEAARSGDRRAFGRLVDAYQQRVYAIAYGIVRDRDEAWDVAQEAFVKAHQSLSRFEGQSAFYTWLYRIAYNVSIDHIRDRGRRRAPRDEPEAVHERSVGAGPEHPETARSRRELAEVLKAAMARLSEKHRAIIVLREVEGLSYEEMAEVLGISKGTVMSRLFHARQNLQEILRPYVETGDTMPDSLRVAVAGGER